MKNLKKLLSKNKRLYIFTAVIYHWINRKLMMFALFFRGVKYLEPKTKLEGNYKSQYGQDWYLEKLGFLSKKNFFVEVGCNHPKINSNSYFLEHVYNYSGISIDAINYKKEFHAFRPKTTFIQSLIDSKETTKIFNLVRNEDGWENQVSSIHKETLTMGKGFTADTIEMKTSTLQNLLPNNCIIDILMIDVEGHEIEVLDSLNWGLNSPRVILIENNGEFYNRSILENFINNKGYKLYARIGTSDDIYVLNDIDVNNNK
tara:strand:+ start:58 stop:834 length:777 start_codon:yes stop_codon:yes gene_type:complete